MIIHVVNAGENIYSIAAKYGVSPASIISENELSDPNRLVVGQTLVLTIDRVNYTVRPGDTLYSIAASYGVSLSVILENNPSVRTPEGLYIGQTITIPFYQPNFGPIEINGYAYPNINRETLRKTLPYLTYLTIFSYGITPEGTLVEIDDTELIRLARAAGVAPLMLLTAMTPDGRFSSENASILLNSVALQEKLLDQIVEVLTGKQYYGIDIDFEYVPPTDREAYVAFIQRTADRLNPLGFTVTVALAPKTSANQRGLLYEAHDYAGIGAAANAVLLMTYEWGYAYGPPMAVSPLPNVKQVIDYAVTEIPPDKIFMGVPNYGYDWTLPFVEGSRAQSLSNTRAVELAAQYGSVIQYDTRSQSPYFYYYDANARQHVVWFEDARSIEAKVKLAHSYPLAGLGYWNLMNFFPQNWLVVGAYYEIQKVL